MIRRYRYPFRHLALVGLLLVGAVLAACTPREVELTDDERADIYATVIRRLATEDDTFGGQLNPEILYIVRATDDSVGDPDVAIGRSEMLGQPLVEEITARLSDLDTDIVWVDTSDEVALEEETGAVPGKGAIITVGNILPQDDGSIYLAGSIYIAGLAAGGQTYVLEEIDGTWTITGTTGVAWIS